MDKAIIKARTPKQGSLKRDDKWAWAMLLPNIVGFLMFMVIPMVATFVLSFMEYDMLTAPRFVGLQNYKDMIADPITRQVTLNTIIYTVLTVPVGMILSLLLAVALDSIPTLKRFYRGSFFLPSITSMVVVSIVWQWIYNPEYGLMNFFLSWFGITPQKWLTSSSTALLSLAIVGIWKRLGYDMVIFLSGLQGISTNYYEAAQLDGANSFQRFWYITVPLLRPTTFFVFVMAIISSFQVFDQVQLMTQGGPGRSSSVLVHYLYQNAFQYFKMGYACALAYLLFAIVLVMTVINMRTEKKMRETF